MTHARPKVGDAHVSLLGPTQVRLGDQHVAHGQHAQPSQLFGGVEHHRWETRGHFGVQANLDTGLDLVFTLDQQVQELLCVDHSFTEVGHQANKGCVPLIHDLLSPEMVGVNVSRMVDTL